MENLKKLSHVIIYLMDEEQNNNGNVNDDEIKEYIIIINEF